jgi:Secretion system C-terminal sorting domain
MKQLSSSILIILIVVFSGYKCFAQDQYMMEWSQRENSQVIPYTFDCGSSWTYECQKVRLDSENNVIVAGSSFENGNYNFLVVKYTNSGSLIWKQLIDISDESADYLTGIFIDNSNNIIITGVSEQNVSEAKSVVIKLNETGDILWQSSFSDEYDWSFPQGMVVDESGNIFLTGCINEQYASKEMFVCKFDSAGNFIWDDIYSLDNSGTYEGLTLRIVDNSLISLGLFFGSGTRRVIILKHSLEGSLLLSNETSYEGNLSRYYIDNLGNSYIGMFGDFKIFKYDQSANEEWTFEVPTNLPDNVTADEVQDIISDEEGNIYLTGRHYGEGYGTSNYTNGDLQVNKISSEGDLIYSYRYENLGANAFDGGNKLFLGNNNYLIVGGRSQDNIGDNYNYLAIVLDNLGEPIDTLRYQGQGDSVIKSVAMDEGLNLYVTGTGDGDTLTQKYSFLGTMSINDVLDKEYRVYPNPFLNKLHIKTKNVHGLADFILLNSNGVIVYKKSFENLSTIDFDNLTIPSGFYFYKINYGGNFESGKLIKN